MQRLREASLLLMFLVLLFSYANKPVPSKPATHETKQHLKTERVKTNKLANSSERFFQIKPRLFPLSLPGNKHIPQRATNLRTVQQAKTEQAHGSTQFVVAPVVPWYQYYYFPDESDEYSVAG